AIAPAFRGPPLQRPKMQPPCSISPSTSPQPANTSALTHRHQSDTPLIMARRLQITLSDLEYREIQKAALSRQMSVADWVRRALAAARRREPSADPGKKLEAIRL